MQRILKNYTEEEAHISYGNKQLNIPAGGQADLALIFLPWQLASCESLINLLSQGVFKFQLNDGISDLSMIDAIDLVRNYQQKFPMQSDGIPIMTVGPREGLEWSLCSHNFSDKCTWFGDSVRVNDEVLSDSGDGLIFVSAHENWIDMSSGRMHRDDLWVMMQQLSHPEDPHGYQVVIKIDGVVAIMREPYETSGGDYEVNWDEGKIEFFGDQSGKIVTASYNYATTSNFYLRPFYPGNVLIVEDVEADLSEDSIMTDTICYGGWHYEDDQSICDGVIKYKRTSQIAAEAKGNFPILVAVGATEVEKQIADIKEFRRKSRGMKYSCQAIPFKYATARYILSSNQSEVRVYTEHHRAMIGESVTITFYCTEKSET